MKNSLLILQSNFHNKSIHIWNWLCANSTVKFHSSTVTCQPEIILCLPLKLSVTEDGPNILLMAHPTHETVILFINQAHKLLTRNSKKEKQSSR